MEGLVVAVLSPFAEIAGAPIFFTTNQGIWAAEGEHPDLRRVPLHGVWIGDELFIFWTR